MNQFPTTPVNLASRSASGTIRTGIAADGNRVMLNVFGTYAELDPEDAMWLAQQLESTAIALAEAEEMDRAAANAGRLGPEDFAAQVNSRLMSYPSRWGVQ